MAAAVSVLALLAAARAASLGTGYGATSSTAHGLDLLATLALLGAGALAWHEQPGNLLAGTAILAGVAWSAQDWIGWQGAPALRTAGALFAPLLAPLVLQLALGRRVPRPLLAGVWAATALIALSFALFRDPFSVPSCWRNCADDIVLVRDVPSLAWLLEPAGAWVAAAGGAALVALGFRMRKWVAVAVGGGEFAYGVERALSAEDPHRTLFAATFLLRAGALTALAVTVAASVVAARRSRLAVARLGHELAADPPGGLRALLARSLGDPSLEVGYWVPARGGYVDLDGLPLAPTGPDRASTSIVREGRPVALIVHDRRLRDELRLGRQIGAAASLAADNERLRAELAAQLDDLRMARTRIVAAADDRRRRLERDLHDSAQQRLLAVGYDLRLAEAAARAASDAKLAVALAGARDDVAAVLGALRRLARGIFPAILDEAGLGPALETLAELAPLATEIRAVPPGPLAPPVRLAIYLVVERAVQAAHAAGASYTVVDVVRDRAVVSADVSTDATAGLDVPVPLQDRLGALGGHVTASGTRIHAEAPCALS
jgi:signal transduction histidine kinase